MISGSILHNENSVLSTRFFTELLRNKNKSIEKQYIQFRNIMLQINIDGECSLTYNANIN